LGGRKGIRPVKTEWWGAGSPRTDSRKIKDHAASVTADHILCQWLPSISDNGPKAISREVFGATSENGEYLKLNRPVSVPVSK